MRRLFAVVAVLLVVGVSCAQTSEKSPPGADTAKPPTPGADAPKISVAKPSFDFGEVGQGEEVTHDFEIENTGKGELQILGVDKTCGCTHAAAKKDRLKPGEKTVVNTTLNTTGKQGLNSITVTVKTNDPTAPSTALTLSGKIALPFRPSVTDLNFGTLTKGKTVASKTFDVLTSGALTINDIKTDHDQVKASYDTIPSEEKKQGFRITVKIDGVLPVGALRSTISIGTSLAAQKTITIPVLALVEGEITAKPRTSNFGTIKRGASATRTIEIEKAGNPDLKIEGVEIKPEGAFTATVEEVRPGRSYRVIIAMSPDVKDGVSRGTVTIKTNCPGEVELQAYFYALLQP